MSTIRPRRTLILALSAFSILASHSLNARADATVEVAFRTEGFRGMGAHEGTTKREVQGNRAREDSDIRFKGKIAGFLAGARDGGQIIRVDLDKVWSLNDRKKTYSERAIRPAQKTIPADAPAKGEPAASDDQPTHRVRRSDVVVKKTGERKTVNGFPTERTDAIATVEIEELATGEVTTYLWNSELWMTPWTAELKRAVDEETAFQKAYLAKMGLPAASGDQQRFGGPALLMMLGLGDKKTGDLIEQIRKKTADVKGYPIVSASEWIVKDDPRAIARRDEARAKAAADEPAPDLTGGAKDVAGSLIGGFAKKKMRERQAKKEKAADGKPVFTAYHEVKSVSTAKIAAGRFEVPPGYRKTK